MSTFDDFLIQAHADEYKGFDDDMPDDYENWLCNIEVDEWIKLGNAYYKYEEFTIINGMQDALEKIKTELRNI